MRQNSEDLRCEANVGPVSDSSSGSAQEIRVKSLVTYSYDEIESVEYVVAEEFTRVSSKLVNDFQHIQ